MNGACATRVSFATLDRPVEVAAGGLALCTPLDASASCELLKSLDQTRTKVY